MKILAVTIPHNDQRYPTVGDYVDLNGVVVFSISEMKDPRYELLVLIHELVEKALVDVRGVKLSTIDAFDMEFEAKRKAGNTDEPGDDPRAPYHQEHRFATYIERMVAAELGVDWDVYDRTVTEL